MYRPDMDYIFFKVADLMAQRSTCTSRIQVGAVLVDSANRIVATGYNGSPHGFPHCTEVGCLLDADGHCIRAIHAEENALLQCAVHGVSTDGLFLFSTHRPCDRCTLRMIQAGVRNMYYLFPYRMPNEKLLAEIQNVDIRQITAYKI